MIERTESNGIVTLRLAHGKASAIDAELLEALQQALDGAADARAIILTGTGSIFSAGVDLFRLTKEGAGYTERFYPLLREVIGTLFSFPRPVVAAANGHAIAGGCIFVLASDYRLMAAGNGRIGVPELLVGVPFPAMALEVVRFAIPKTHLQRLIYTGATLKPEEALQYGMIDEVVDPTLLEARAMEIATQLAAIPAKTFAIVKRDLRAPALENIRRATSDDEALAVWSDPEIHAGIRAYLDRTVGKKA